MNGASTIDIIIFIAAMIILLGSCFVQSNSWTGKLVSIIAVLLGTTLIVTGMLRLLPGNPVDNILGDQAPHEARLQLAQDLNLVDAEGKPLGFIAQYGQFVRQVSQNELLSYRTREPVLTMIVQRLPYTLCLAFFSMLFALTIGPALGIAAAARKGSFFDVLLMFLALLGISLPRFFLGPLLLLVLSIHWHIFPISGAADGFWSVILPAVSLGLAMAAMQARMVRASILEIMSEDYIRSARAKGLSENQVYFKHALRNALLPVITVVGLELGGLLAGSVVTEKIFNWPGIGLLLLESIQRLDMPIVQGVVLTIAFGYVFINLLTDLSYQRIDPRIRLQTQPKELK
jgi:peptide/nickel transport system permease protein